MGSSVRYTRSKMKLLALIAASATATFDSIVKDDANRNSNPGGFSLSEGITIKGDGSCPKCEDEASLAACIVVDKFETCEGIENALCEYTFKYDQNGDAISVSSQCKDHVACHDNMRQNLDKGNQILSKCQKGDTWPANRNGRYGAQDFQCITCFDRYQNALQSNLPIADDIAGIVAAVEAREVGGDLWNSQ